jgi:hypothetical protein
MPWERLLLLADQTQRITLSTAIMFMRAMIVIALVGVRVRMRSPQRKGVREIAPNFFAERHFLICEKTFFELMLKCIAIHPKSQDRE